jgi:D-sedoheptulose 7-phosphate isomerase
VTDPQPSIPPNADSLSVDALSADPLSDHLVALSEALESLAGQGPEIDAWGRRLARRLDGGRLLVAGNGGSAAEAQHLTAELVGRFQGERRPLSALALHAETSTLTAVLNDYGPDEIFARQVEAHGRAGDVLVLISTSGRSPNLLAAARRASSLGIEVWAMTGPTPNALACLASRVIAIDSPSTSAIQECHLVAVHGVCAALEAQLRLPAVPAGQRSRVDLQLLQEPRAAARDAEVAS